MACMSRSASMLGLLVPGLRGFISFALLPSRSQMLNCCDMPSSDLTFVHICANVLSLVTLLFVRSLFMANYGFISLFCVRMQPVRHAFLATHQALQDCWVWSQLVCTCHSYLWRSAELPFCRAQVNQAGGKLSDYIGWTQQRLHLRSFANASSGKINDKLLCSCTFAASLCCENVPIQFCSCYCKLLLSPFVSFCTVSARHTPMYTDSNSMQFWMASLHHGWQTYNACLGYS